jgi:hypothetical protein
MKLSPEFRPFKQEALRKQQEEEVHAQGKILADVIGAKFSEFIAAQQATAVATAVPSVAQSSHEVQGVAHPFPPPCPAAGRQPNILEALKASPRPNTRAASDGEEEDEGFALPPILRRLAAAELGHGLRFKAGTLQEFKDAISDSWESSLGNALEQAIHNYDARMKFPRARSDRIEAYCNLLLRKGASL